MNKNIHKGEDKRFMENAISNPLGEIYCYGKKFKPSEISGPSISEDFNLCYVINGKGEFTMYSKKYKLEKGHIFIIFTNSTFTLKADSNNPWELGVIGFDGALFIHYLSLMSIYSHEPVIQYNVDDYLTNLFEEMLQTEKYVDYIGDIKLTGLIFLFFGRLMEFNSINNIVKRTREELYIYDAMKYINENYNKKISVNEVTKVLGLDRSYFSKLFKKLAGVSPQQYILQYKIDKACELLANTYLGIGYISDIVGYNNYFSFSKTFKKIKGISPVSYRRLLVESSTIKMNKRGVENYETY